MLKSRLFILTISIITISLLLSGIVSYKNINSIFTEQSIIKFNHDIKIFDTFIKEHKNHIKSLANEIAKNKDLASSINLISNYQDPNNYINNLFNQEKEELLKLTKQWISLKDGYSLALYDKNKKLILINKNISENKSIGYVSFDKNANPYFIDKINPDNRELPNIKPFKNVFENKFIYNHTQEAYILIYFHPVKIEDKTIGYIKICFSIETKTLKPLKERLLNDFFLKTNEKNYIYENKNINEILASKNFLIKTNLAIQDKNYPLSFVTIIDKKPINEKLKNTLNTIIFIWIIILIVTLLLSFVFTDKYILNPINKLHESIQAIRKKRVKYFNENKEIYTTKLDEIALINEEFNVLATELDKNLAFLESYKSVMDEGSIVSKSDLKGNITYVNENFINISGFTKEESIGSPHNIVRHPDTPSETFKNLWETINNKKVWKGVLKNLKKDGGYYWVDIVIRPILDENNEIVEYIAVRHDITEIMEQRETINKMVNTDNLTNLNSRYKLIKDIQEANQPSLAFLNIDSFRQVNDFYGHTFGDILIKKVALIIQKEIEEFNNLILYRTQADEFAILTEITDNFRNENFQGRIFNLLREVNNQNIEIENEEISINLTAGISSEKKDIILSTANMALRRAKKLNNDVTIYKEEFSLDKIYENNIKWAKKLKSAINEDRIVPYYQPIVNNETKKYEKYESLVRLIDEDGKVISPFFFLDIAKKSKYYTKLTKIMIKKSFEMFKDKDLEFSINLTIDDILNKKIKAYIFKMLENYEVNNQVVFEIVESESIENFEKVLEFITEVKKYGCKIAIDDFGTGYSNFEYLMKLKADYIKIDGSMIKNIHNNDDAKMVVSIIVDFAKKMNMKTIAEYVENEEILKVVNELGIDYSQGYHFSAPKESLE